MNISIVVLFACLPAIAGNAHAHGGGLNGEGCHNDRKHGDYHCHRGPSAGARGIPGNTFAPAQPMSRRASAGPTGAFANCTAARAAGAAPVRRGDPGYGSHLDRDNDGIGCE